MQPHVFGGSLALLGSMVDACPCFDDEKSKLVFESRDPLRRSLIPSEKRLYESSNLAFVPVFYPVILQ